MDKKWWVERSSAKMWVGHNSRGSSVVMAPSDAGVPGSFTPGELLKLALGGCAGMTSEGPAARRLGDDYTATIVIDGTDHETEDRYQAFTEHILIDAATLDQAGRDALIASMARAIDHSCTVGLTVRNGASVTVTIEDAPS